MKFAQPFFYVTVLHVTMALQSADETSRCVIDAVPVEVTAQHIFSDVLSTNPAQARELLAVSHYFLKCVNDPRTIKHAVAKRDRAFSSYDHARAINIIAAQYYVNINEDLCRYDEKGYKATNKNIYFFTLKANTYADVNYIPKPVSDSSGETVAYSKLLRHCMFPEQKDNWIIDLLKVGADPNDYYKDKRQTPMFFFCTTAFDQTKMISDQLQTLSQLLHHGANPNGIDDGLTRLAVGYDNMTSLKMLMDFGARLYKFEIHTYLDFKHSKQQTPSLATLEFFLQHGCDPYLQGNKEGEEGSLNAFDMVDKMNVDETMKNAIKDLFKKDRSERMAKRFAQLEAILQRVNDRANAKKSDE